VEKSGASGLLDAAPGIFGRNEFGHGVLFTEIVTVGAKLGKKDFHRF
jgi:hypothetical protein